MEAESTWQVSVLIPATHFKAEHIQATVGGRLLDSQLIGDATSPGQNSCADKSGGMGQRLTEQRFEGRTQLMDR